MTTLSASPASLQEFVSSMGAILDRRADEATVIREGAALLGRLVSRDDWLPAALARPHPEHYQQYLLHADPADRFSVVSFVWGPGQTTPVHNHTVWGLIGMLRGAEYGQAYAITPQGPVPQGEEKRLAPGEVDAVSPTVGDVHRVRNAFDDRVSISIHVYGGNIGKIRRSVFLPDGGAKEFVSGYAEPGEAAG